MWSTLGAYLAPLVAAAAERHPHVELSVCQLRFVEIVAALRRGDVDLAITRPLHADSEMLELTLRHEPSVLAIPERHAFARQATVAVAQLDGTAQVALRRDLAPTAYDAVIAAARELGVELRIVQETRSPSEALALVSAGIGVYRLPSSAAQPYPGIVYRELEEAPSRVVLMRRPEPPAPAVAAIAELAEDLFGDADRVSNNGARGLEEAPSAPSLPRVIVSLGRRLRASTRVRALILLWRASPALSILAVAFVLAEGALPVLVLIAMGRVTGAIPGAVLFGLVLARPSSCRWPWRRRARSTRCH